MKTSLIDEKGEEMVRRLLLDLSQDENKFYTLNVTDYNEKTDRRNEDTHWDLEVKSKIGSCNFMVQVKSSSSNFPQIEVKHLYDWLKKEIPTVLIVYLLNENKAFWLIPQLLIAARGDIALPQKTCKPTKSEYRVLNKDSFNELIDTVVILNELHKKKVVSDHLYPNTYKDLSKHLISFEFDTIEKKMSTIFNALPYKISFQLLDRFYDIFLPKIFTILLAKVDLDSFIKKVNDSFKITFKEVYKYSYQQQITPLESYITEWALDIHRLSMETKIDLYAYRNLQKIINYSKDGDWEFLKWSHGSLWTVSKLSRFYNQDLYFEKLKLILQTDSNNEVINAATYLLRHISPSSFETLFNQIPSLEKRYTFCFDQGDKNNKALIYHLRYAAMMHGDKDSLYWLLDIASTNEWREPMLLFNIEHAKDNPQKYIRSMSLKVFDPRKSEAPIVKLSNLILTDFSKTLK